jgi:hypothetical protein
LAQLEQSDDRHQAFTIRSVYPWWQSVIDMLMHSSDFVVMDVSRVSGGSAWEIHHLEGDVLVNKCIFIVQEAHEGDGAASIAHLFPAHAQPKIFVYNEKGVFKEQAQFDAALEAAVTRSVESWGKRSGAAGQATMTPGTRQPAQFQNSM